MKAHRPEVIVAFSSSEFYTFREEFGYEIPYILLHSDEKTFSGIPEDQENCLREGIDLLHFCRRTHRWGIPARRIDHVMEPIWFEGTTLPQKGSTGTKVNK